MAGEGDAERLIVLLEARVRDFERNMAKASGTATRQFSTMRQGSQRATRQMEADMVRSTGRINQALASTSTRMGSFARVSLGGLAAGFLAGVAPILSVAAALNTAKRALEDFDKLGNRAKMFGVNVESLQELRFAAEQGGMAIDNFDTAFRRFIRRSAEAAQGTGAAKDAFKELGIELLDNNGRLKASEVLLREVADALQKVPSQADKLRLAFKMFDTDGAAMVNVLSGGAAGLDDFARKARDLGIVVDEHLIARAQEMKAEFDTAARVLDLQFKQALVNLAPILTWIAQQAANVAGVIRDIGDAVAYAIGNWDAIGTGNLETRFRILGQERVEIENEILRLQSQQTGFDPLGWATTDKANQIEHLRGKLQSLADEEQRILDILNNRPTFSSPAIPDLEDLEVPEAVTASRVAAANATIQQAEAVARLIENLRFEQEQLGRTAEEQELYNLLKQAGVERESEFGQAIESTLGALQAQRKLIEQNAEAMRMFESMASKAMSSFIDDLIDGKDAGEALSNMFRDLARQLLQMATNQIIQSFLGGLTGLFGMGGGFSAPTPFMPGFATGTANTGGRRGEPRGIVHGQEAVIPLPSGGKVPVQIAGGRPSGHTYNFENIINVTVQGGGNDMLANPRAIARAVEQAVNKQIADNMRAGGLLNPRL